MYTQHISMDSGILGLKFQPERRVFVLSHVCKVSPKLAFSSNEVVMAFDLAHH